MGTMQKLTISIIQWEPGGEKGKKQFCSRKSGLLFCERKVQQKTVHAPRISVQICKYR